MIRIQEINFPQDCVIINNDFYNYDPVNSFSEVDSLKYLNEDLLQCTFPEYDIIIDLGWYGDIISNIGEFRIYIIQNENWEIPFNIIHSKSTEEVRGLLTKILQYYTRTEIETESDNI